MWAARVILFLLSFLAVFVSTARAQTPESPAFEVATVRENASGDLRFHIEVLPGGRFNATNMTLWQILALAYPIDGRFRDDIHLVGGPSWVKSTRFDIVAKAEGAPRLDTNKPGATVTDDDRDAVERIRMMLRKLVIERFKLQLRHETQQLPIYELVRVRGDGALGRDLKSGAPDCGSACGSIQRTGPTNVVGRSVSSGSLAHTMSDWVGRTVVDATGIHGPIDFTLTWAPEAMTGSDAPSIFTAVREQLGLKLEPSTGPIDVLVIDSAERPTPD